MSQWGKADPITGTISTKFPNVVPDAGSDGPGGALFALDAPVWIVYVYELPLAASGWHPEHLGALLAASRWDTMPWVTAEVNRFVGWFLELLLLLPGSEQLRRRLGIWQQSLQQRCRHVPLEWFQAMAVYGLKDQLCQGYPGIATSSFEDGFRLVAEVLGRSLSTKAQGLLLTGVPPKDFDLAKCGNAATVVVPVWLNQKPAAVLCAVPNR